MSGVLDDIGRILKVEVSEDALEAKLVARDSCDGLTADNGIALLKERGITEGLLYDELGKVGTLKAGQSLVVARGVKAEETVQAKADYFFPLGDKISFESQKNGTIDFREIGRFNNTKEGSVLAVLTPGKEGTTGIDVYGRTTVPDKLIDKKLRCGKLVSLSADGMQAIAKANGHACRIDGKITILTKIQIPGDIDYSVGNIRFLGDVDVSGNVLSGFTVEVQGSLTITKNIENARIEVGKDLKVNGNVFGRGEGFIEVGGDATFNEIDSAKINVMGNLKVRNAIRHSTVRCGGSIELTSSNGVIVGGDVSALQKIKAANIGNSMGTMTKVSVGRNPFIADRLSGVGEALAELKAKRSQVQNHFLMLQKKIAAGPVSPAIEELSIKLRNAELALQKEIAEKEEEEKELKSKAVGVEKAIMEITGTLHSSVLVTIRRLKVLTYDKERRVRAEEEEGEIKFTPLYGKK
ncbi:DUF342 domain-containing protein [bacterium]|nr:DUF342 domain-containing protein [bacterium]